jgi:hypothetical protein
VDLFFGTGIWTQGLHLKPLHQSFFSDGFFQDRVLWTVCPGWLQTLILLIQSPVSGWITFFCVFFGGVFWGFFLTVLGFKLRLSCLPRQVL